MGHTYLLWKIIWTTLCQGWSKLTNVFLRRCFLECWRCIFAQYFAIISCKKKTLHLNRLESLSPKDPLWQIWLKLNRRLWSRINMFSSSELNAEVNFFTVIRVWISVLTFFISILFSSTTVQISTKLGTSFFDEVDLRLFKWWVMHLSSKAENSKVEKLIYMKFKKNLFSRIMKPI